MASSSSNFSGERPIPPRYRWLKRILIAVVTLVIALVVAQRWWAHAADRRYQASIDAARARGEPVLPADFLPDGPVPDSRNAALSLANAAGSLALSQAFHDFANNYPSDGPHSRKQN